MRQRSRPAVPDDAAVIENLLKLGSCGPALSRCQIRLAPKVRWIETRTRGIGRKRDCSKLKSRESNFQGFQGRSWIVVIQFQLRLSRWKPKGLHLCVQWK